MKALYLVDKELLKKCKELGHCTCHLKNVCPCDEFLNEDKCICGAYERWDE